jgi:hypothetical protein
MRIDRLALTVLISTAACRSGPEPIKEPPLAPPDAQELFHRARFGELTKDDPEQIDKLALQMQQPGASDVERYADFMAKQAYREGDGKKALETVAVLGAENRTRRILEPLLQHADLARPLRGSNLKKGTIDLPLASVALDRGYPIVEVEIAKKTLRLLWDTGATENMLSPSAAETLALDKTDVQFLVMRKDDGLVVRFGASAVDKMDIGPWKLSNVPMLVAELDTIENLKRDIHEIDGFLSPQLLVPHGCFRIDRVKAILTVGFSEGPCREMMETAQQKSPLFNWNGEVYTSARVYQSPELAVQLETGSSVSFLRNHAARWLPRGVLREAPEEMDGEIAHGLKEDITIQVAGRAKNVSAIDLAPTREARAYDDIATLGNDVLLQGRGVIVSFASNEMGALALEPARQETAQLTPAPKAKNKNSGR